MNFELNKDSNKFICPECKKEYTKNGIGTHYWRMHTEAGSNFNPNKGYEDGSRQVWNKGLTKETDYRVKNRGKVLSSRYKSGELKLVGFCSNEYIAYTKTEEYKRERSILMKNVVLNNPVSYSKNNVSGRVKNYDVKLGDEIYTFKGSWEVLVATALFENGICFTNVLKPIEYFWKESGKIHLYFPDFYLPEADMYIEVKGFKRDRDNDKWDAVSNLYVIDSEEINKIKLKEFDFSKFKK